MNNRKSIFSTLWIFVTLNYLYCDVAGLMDKSLLRQYYNGNVGGMDISEPFLLIAGIIMEIPIGMVLLSVILNYRTNRVANILAGTIKTIVMIMTLFAGKPTIYYAFFATIEISTTAFIVWYAWKWREEKTAAA